MNNHPPRLAEWLIARSLPRDVREPTLGDLAEGFSHMLLQNGRGAAEHWYWRQVRGSLNPMLRWSFGFGSLKRKSHLAGQRIRGDIMLSVLQDVRYGLRAAFKNIGFTIVVVMTLGLGIGANTAIFSVVDGILLRPLPYPNPEQLVTVWADYSVRSGRLREWLSYPNFHDLRQDSEVFEEVGIWTDWNPTLTGLGSAELVTGSLLSAGMLTKVLGIPPALGRAFSPDDDKPNAPNVVLISHGFWTRHFGGDPAVVGQSISLNGIPNTIVGVMPAGFRPPFVPNAELWKPFQMDITMPNLSRGTAFLRSFARIRDGTPLETARARATDLGARLEAEYPGANTGVGYVIFPLRSDLVRQTTAPLWVLLGAVGFVLLIACVNVANLLLARMTSRQTELAVRAALGAGGSRLMRQLLTESAVFAVLGGVVGFVIAFVGTDALVALAPSGTPRIAEVAVDLRVLLFAGGATALATFLFGLLPALRGARTDIHDALKVGGRGMDASAGGRAVGGVLVIGQVALALILLVGAGLMIRSLRELNAVDLGFEPAGMLTMTLNLPQVRYQDRVARADFFNRLETRLSALPGVESLGSVSVVPLSGNNSDTDFYIEGRPLPGVGESQTVWYRRATPTYFETMGIRVIRGRGFTPSDDGQAPPVTIINQTFAERFFPDEEPIGKRINVNGSQNPIWREIVGVAENIKNFGIATGSRDATYFPFAQLPTSFMAVVLRTAGDPTSLIPSVRNAIAELDPDLAASNVTTLAAMVQASLGSQRFVTVLLTLFGAVAVVLAAVGLYGVVSYGVTRRVHEMGLRVALGAASGDIRKLIIGNSVMLTGAGVAVGIVGALLLTRVMGGLLFGVRPTDPVTFGVTAVLLTGVAVVASALPAQRAVKVDPMTVLKNE